MKWLRRIYFDYNGRINRIEFWLFSWAIGIVFNLLVFGPVLIARANGYEPTGWNFVIAIGRLLSLWPETALFIKRGHDRDRPAAWSIAVLVVGPAISLVLPILGSFGLVIAVLFALYFVIDYGLGPGNPDANIYGRPDRGIIKGRALVLSE